MHDSHSLAGTSLRLTVIEDRPSLRALVDPWNGLLRETPGSCAYQSPEWVSTWFDRIACADQPYVLVVHRGDRLVGVAPFAVTRLGVAPAQFELLLSAATEPGDYGDPLLAPDVADDVARLIVEHIGRFTEGFRSAIALRRLNERGSLFRAIAARDDLGVVQTSEFTAPITRFADWDDPSDQIDRLASDLKLPKQRRRLEREHGEIRVDTKATVAVSLSELAEMHRRRFGSADAAPPLLQRPRSLAFVTEAIEKLNSVGIARTCRLEAGDSTAAIELGHNVASRWVGQAAGFDPEFGKFRPGYMLVEAILHTALDEGALEYDHGQGAREYKLHWATTQRVHRSVVVTHAGWRGEGQRLAQRFVASRRARRLLTGPVTGPS